MATVLRSMMAGLDRLGALGWDQIGGTFIAAGSDLSIGALACTLLIAIGLILSRPRRRPVPLAVLRRALFPRRLLRSASGRADLVYFLFSLFLFSLVFGWALASGVHVAGAISGALTDRFGVAPQFFPAPVAAGLLTVLVFLAYEFAYWLDHYCCHKVPILWQFHRVHHGAEHLSLLTNYRIHPVDAIVFGNLAAVMTGTAWGLGGYLLGQGVRPVGIGGSNVLILLSMIGVTHLQHSHIWFRFGPRLGRWLLGPAHHQIHHSANPEHFDRNFGGSLAIFDRLFGTLHLPDAVRQPLTFGLGAEEPAPHGLKAALVTPLTGAAACLARSLSYPVRGFLRRPI